MSLRDDAKSPSRVPMSQLVDVTMGTAPPGSSYNDMEVGVPLIAGASDFGEKHPEPSKWTTEPSKVCEPGDLILCIRATIGDTNWADREYCLGRGVAGLRPKGMCDISFISHYIAANQELLAKNSTGSTFQAIKRAHVEEFPVPKLPLEEQRRIAAILDKADALRRKRQEALTLLNDLLRSTFLDIFGDPVTNPKGWPTAELGELALKFLDGPFGSKLKTCHYTEDGVRVIRLQNIGVGEFLDDDQVYISEKHFQTISKHECRPGDVLIGTMGNPNLRACILPGALPRALNKADCVQLRPRTELATKEYLCELLNRVHFHLVAEATGWGWKEGLLCVMV